MNIPFGKRQLVIQVEQGPAEFAQESALDGATDREIEKIARNQNRHREPRWESAALVYGWRI